MKWLLSYVLFLFTTSAWAQSPTVSPAFPPVNQGTTQQFTNTGGAGTWTCAGTDASGAGIACRGSINSSTGLYTAPALVNAQQSYGGYQLLPINHIFNTRIDTLPLATNGTTYAINASPTGAVRTGCPGSCVDTITVASAPPNVPYYVGQPITLANVTDSTFNGTFTIGTLPGGCSNLCFTFAQAGQANSASGGGTILVTWTSYFAGQGDSQNYLQNIGINYTDGSTPISDMVFGFTPPANGPFQLPAYPGIRVQCGWLSNPSACDHHIFTVDTTNGTFQELYNLLPNGSHACPSPCTADSGVKYLNSTYDLDPGGSIDTTAAGNLIMPLHIHMQEFAQALATSGAINHAVSWTLQNGYLCGSSTAGACGQPGGQRYVWPATASNFSASGILPFGARFRLKSSFDISSYSVAAKILLTQLKQYGAILTDGGGGMQTGIEMTAWNALGIFPTDIIGLLASNFEAVNESGIEISALSGQTTVNREIITFTRTSDSATATTDVVLTGVTVNMAKDVQFIQAGTAAQQLIAYAHGAANTSLTWTMSPSVGTLSASGLFTPPATIGSVTKTTITATSVANSAIAANMLLTVFPVGPIRIVPGWHTPYAPDNVGYTDTFGNFWAPFTGWDTGGAYSNNVTTTPVPNVALYNYPLLPGATGTGNDTRFDFTVPNGNYQLIARCSNDLDNPHTVESFEVQGQVIYSNIDLYVAAGNSNTNGVDFILPATVTNNTLSFVVRYISGFGGISSLSIISSPPPGTTLTPGMTVTSGVSIK